MLARAAVEAGVRIVISTDAHRVHELDNLELGVAQARRGWLTSEVVVNTRTWAQVKKLHEEVAERLPARLGYEATLAERAR